MASGLVRSYTVVPPMLTCWYADATQELIAEPVPPPAPRPPRPAYTPPALQGRLAGRASFATGAHP